MSDNGGAVTIGVGVGASQLPTEHANASFGLVQPAACTSEHAGAVGGCSAWQVYSIYGAGDGHQVHRLCIRSLCDGTPQTAVRFRRCLCVCAGV